MRRTKIVCTLGPSSDTTDAICALIKEGLDVARFNFSHGSHEEHGARMNLLREARARTGKNVAILLDVKGIKIRMGYIEGYSDATKKTTMDVRKGETVEFVCDPAQCGMDGTRSTPARIFIDYAGLPAEVRVGQHFLIDDGLLTTTITAISGNMITARVENNATITSRRSVNVPGAKLKIEFLTPQDEADILFGIKEDVDFVALSFVRRLEDVVKARQLLDANGGKHIRIISKIENEEGVENLDDILTMSDGVMVARGDMAVELPYYQVPGIQKRMIRKALQKGKVVITATQMLHSMIKEPVPTRAEVSDIFNAVEDLTTAIMLSAETSSGDYPRESVRVMNAVATAAEEAAHYDRTNVEPVGHHVTTSICHAAVTLAHQVDARAIVAYSESGNTARRLSSIRTHVPLLLISDNERVVRQCHMRWGLMPVLQPRMERVEELFSSALRVADEHLKLEDGDTIVVLAGSAVGLSGSTNTIRVMAKGDVLLRGTTLNTMRAKGPVRVCKNVADAQLVRPGEVAVLYRLAPDMLPALKNAGAVLLASTEYDRELAEETARRIPVLIDVRGVETRVNDGMIVDVIGSKHVVLRG